MLNKYERARVIGARALQLFSGAPPLINVSPEKTPLQIAMEEFRLGVLPIVVIRENIKEKN
ncbi:MAG: DNA-directed RNA polymerase subunit K [Candidatus Omnitrophica bacterium]|nr:DNA-directed RNA polymerase subunit K [Candidatus Omnitrophota bacterium]